VDAEMSLMQSPDQAKWIRSRADRARHRLWIASPFIGSWRNVRRILGKRWLERHVDVKVITDERNATSQSKKTIRCLLSAGRVKSLQGLHAKVYILDDFVLVSSANLTGAAFARRHEAGICLGSGQVAGAVRLFDQWWNSPDCVALNVDSIPSSEKRTGSKTDETSTDELPIIWELPPDPGDVSLDSDLSFYGYQHFLECYVDLAQEYSRLQRLWKRSPLYFEVDAFLDYLYHEHPRTPSKTFGTSGVSQINHSARRLRIAKYAKEFARWLRTPDCKHNSVDRMQKSKVVRAILKRNLRRNITWSDVQDLLDQLNCMKSLPIARDKFLRNNRLGSIRRAWRKLANETIHVQKRMIDCCKELDFCGRSTIQEIIGFHDPKRYPLRNQNSNCGLRFFGYKVAKY
jgi:hypothetical protein